MHIVIYRFGNETSFGKWMVDVNDLMLQHM